MINRKKFKKTKDYSDYVNSFITKEYDKISRELYQINKQIKEISLPKPT